MRSEYVVGGLVIVLVVAIGLSTVSQGTGEGGDGSAGEAFWMNTTLQDVNTDEEFAIGSFDEPVLVETFAVWCTTCTRQQQEVKRLHEQRHDFISVSLNTDANEGPERVRTHTERNNFTWRYSVSPPVVTQSLIDEFGSSITIAPQAPMVILCPDGSRERLENGVKPASHLSERLDEVC